MELFYLNALHIQKSALRSKTLCRVHLIQWKKDTLFCNFIKLPTDSNDNGPHLLSGFTLMPLCERIIDDTLVTPL